ncbi:hypothetical protein J2T57_002319 [Natronocella acetinitrilica]|uniref:DUF2726 domain-containing protein n=1 Tax=Natronocella acetinitrilica TaxID=414046 RepID=A0AAE3KBZ7_9GAMM|nr:DUF2726 domain-containing protein [Natronocella acetinitrilica]MCP1675171.1 hypothetical protein [Natronocella acetinitrilica]
METLYIPVTVIVLLAAIVWYRLRVRSRFRRQTIRVRPSPVMDESTAHAYLSLVRALPDHLVFPSVSYSAFLRPHGDKARQTDGDVDALLHAHVIDFLICRPTTEAVAAVRLQGQDASATEAEALLREAAIPVLRYDPKRPMDEMELAETVRDLESLSTVRLEDVPGIATTPAPKDGDRRARRRATAARDRQEPRL